MTIQVSITIWTIICFLVLFFVLRNLLFGPVIEVMDKRRKKIDDARAAKEEAVLSYEKEQSKIAEEREAARIEAVHAAEEKVEALRIEGKELLEKAREEHLKAVEDFRHEIGREYVRDLSAMRAPLGLAADRFLEHLYAGKS